VCAGMHVRAFVRPWARAVACMLQCAARACTCANSSKRRPSADLVAKCEAAAHAAHDVDDRAYLCARPPVLVVCVCLCARMRLLVDLCFAWLVVVRSATCCKRVATDHAALCCKTSCCAQQLIVLRARPKRQTTVARDSAANNDAKARRFRVRTRPRCHRTAAVTATATPVLRGCSGTSFRPPALPGVSYSEYAYALSYIGEPRSVRRRRCGSRIASCAPLTRSARAGRLVVAAALAAADRRTCRACRAARGTQRATQSTRNKPPAALDDLCETAE
jgi:hypothetical protein